MRFDQRRAYLARSGLIPNIQKAEACERVSAMFRLKLKAVSPIP
jgi:hypothetical protein